MFFLGYVGAYCFELIMHDFSITDWYCRLKGKKVQSAKYD